MKKLSTSQILAIVGAAAGFAFYTAFALVDFALETIDFTAVFMMGMYGFLSLGGFTLIQRGGLLVSLLLGLVGFIVGAAIGLAFSLHGQGIALIAVSLAGAVIGALLFGGIGKFIEVWKRDGFQHVKFRVILVFIGFTASFAIAVTSELSNPDVPRGNWLPAGIFTGLLFSLPALLFGWLIDRKRKPLQKPSA